VPKLKRSDYDQAARYLSHACELLERDAKAQTRVLRDVLDLAIRRLSPGDDFVGDAAERSECALRAPQARRAATMDIFG